MFVYILCSPSSDGFYIGLTTGSIEDRLQRHLSDYYDNKFTSKLKDWEIFLTIPCTSNQQARSIETHIKKMKSKTYIKNLKKYSEMSNKLLDKYASS